MTLGREDEHGVFAVLIFCGKLVGFAVAYRFDEDGAYFLMVIVRLIIRLLGSSLLFFLCSWASQMDSMEVRMAWL